MDNQLTRYAGGGVAVPRQDRAVAREAKAVYDEVRLSAMKSDGSMALAAHIMEQAVQLDQLRQTLAQGDPVTSAMLAQFETTAFQQVQSIQRNLFSGWSL